MSSKRCRLILIRDILQLFQFVRGSLSCGFQVPLQFRLDALDQMCKIGILGLCNIAFSDLLRSCCRPNRRPPLRSSPLCRSYAFCTESGPRRKLDTGGRLLLGKQACRPKSAQSSPSPASSSSSSATAIAGASSSPCLYPPDFMKYMHFETNLSRSIPAPPLPCRLCSSFLLARSVAVIRNLESTAASAVWRTFLKVASFFLIKS